MIPCPHRPLSALYHCLVLVQARHAASRSRPRALPPSYPTHFGQKQGGKTATVSRRPNASPLNHRPIRYGHFGDEIRANMDSFPDAILLTQVGKFYESYFEQAPKVAEVCRITLSSKDWTIKDTNLLEKSPFCGFPIGGLAKHLRSLVDAFGAVVLVDEVEMNDDGTKRRAITRIVTPATLLDDGLFDASVPNYLLAVSTVDEGRLGLAWVDPSTGDFFEQEAEVGDLRDVVARVAPVEIVLRAEDASTGTVKEIANAAGIRLSSFSKDVDRAQMSATELAVSYLGANMPLANEMWDSNVEKLHRSLLMRIDATAFAALEIRASSHRASSTLGSLLHAVKRTVTPGGSRLLLQRLSAPSTDVSEIERRHDLIEALLTANIDQERLGAILSKCGDHARVVQQARRQKGQPGLLMALRDLLQGISDLKASMSDCSDGPLHDMATLLVPLPELAERLSQIIRLEASVPPGTESEANEDPETVNEVTSTATKGVLFSSGWSFAVQETASPALLRAHENLHRMQREAQDLQDSLRQDNGNNRIHLSVSARDEPFVRLTGRGDLAGHRLIRTLKGSKHYEYESWTQLFRSMMHQRALIMDLEAGVLGQLQNAVLAEAVTLRKNGQVLDELDVARSFALLVHERGYIRPVISNDNVLDIVDGVHPVVADALNSQGQHFTPNGLSLGGDRPCLSIVTGPNMGGKSTFLRQSALLIILAQAGGYVPAASARIGICDAIYTRIGASDDLFRGQSTFMLEMAETAHILNNASEASLVIMDEIGRGTAPHEGLAIAYAVADHLVTANMARTLFATHFHDVIDLLQRDHSDRINLLCTELKQDEEGVLTFSHRVRPGANREAGALLVARHAGIPQTVLDKASHVLETLKLR